MTAQREWFEKDYYAVLGVPEGASQKEIKASYRKLSRQLHPDANPGDGAAEERFKSVSAAYDVLGDEAKRKEYDEVRRLGPMGGGGNPFGGGGFDSGNISDLLGDLLGRARTRAGRGSAGPRGTGPQRGADLESELQLSFEGAAAGVETSVNLTSEAACSTCHGSGAKPGTVPKACAVCGGRGVTDDDQGFFSFSQPCRACRGQGFVVDEPCSSCRGSGVERKARQVKVRVPAGVRDGQRIRLAGRGAPGRNGGPAGDLYVVVRVAPHPVFGRSGDDLTVTVPVTFPEATLGADVAVPTLDGPPVTIKVPPGTRSGRTFRVRGKGIHSAKKQGDLLVTTEVAVPAKLTKDERKAVEALAAATTASPRSPGGRVTVPADRALYIISVAAELAGVHPQTLRIYERKGLVDPARTAGGSRRYSDADIAQLQRIQQLTAEGLNLAGVQQVLRLEAELAELQRQLAELQSRATEAVEDAHRQHRRDLVPMKQAVVLYRGR